MLTTARTIVCTTRLQRLPIIRGARLHQVAFLPYATESGLSPLFSKKALELLYNERQSQLIYNVNRLSASTQFEKLPLINTITLTAESPSRAALYNNASQAWNNDFFLQTLTADKREIREDVKKRIAEHFDNFDLFKQVFTASAKAIFGNGWTWLLLDRQGRLIVTNTYNAGSPFTLFPSDNSEYTPTDARGPVVPATNANYKGVTTTQRPQNRPNWRFQKFAPILGLNMWQEAYLLDYGLDKEAYIAKFWEVVNWDLVHQRLFKNESLSAPKPRQQQQQQQQQQQ